MIKNPPSSSGDEGSIPGWGTKIPHALGQLRPGPQKRACALKKKKKKRYISPVDAMYNMVTMVDNCMFENR